jgi:hypothetical protein
MEPEPEPTLATGEQLKDFQKKKVEEEQTRLKEQNPIPFGLIIDNKYTVKFTKNPNIPDKIYKFIKETRNSNQTIKDLLFEETNGNAEREVAYTIKDIESNGISFEKIKQSTGGGRKRKHRKSKRRINRKKRRTRRNSKK